MKRSDWIFLSIIVGLLLIALLWMRHRRKKLILAQLATGIKTPGAVQGAPGPNGNILTSAEGLASAYTHVPLDKVGAAAQRAPTWAKVALFPVGLTSISQSIISHPGKIGSIAKDAGTAGEHLAKSAASSVAHAATKTVSSIGSAIGHFL